MGNMAYCRFENTLTDLEDCQDNFNRVESVDEAQAAIDLYRLCATIVNDVSLSRLERKLKELEQELEEDEDDE
jgi:hypothetical protein